MRSRTRNLALAAFGCAALVGALVATRRTSTGDAAPRSTPAPPREEVSPNVTARSVTPAPSAAAPEAVAALDGGPRALLRAAWGSSEAELGRSRQQEGNAEGPMSFALAGRELVVVDQVNGRVVRYGEDGRPRSTTSVAATVQDVAVAKDGRMLLLDRLGERAITLVDRSGRPSGRLSLEAAGITEPGMVTGMFVEGSNVYVEKEHGALVRVGTTEGEPAEAGEATLAGRPSKDGTMLVTATIASKAAGRVAVNAIDRKSSALRYARQLTFPRPLDGLALLDTDDRNVVYVGAVAGGAGRVTIACLDPADGHALGFVVVPHSTTPDESFRDFAVGGDGTIVYALRTESGVEYLTARCP